MIRRLISIFTMCLVLTAAVDAFACRIIEPRPMPMPPDRIMPPRHQQQEMITKRHQVDVHIKDQVAEVTVNATFHNPNNFRMEGTYWFPLPSDAAIKEFRMEINGTMMTGELLDADKARGIYENIVRSQMDPGLLEWIGTQILQCRVFPMEPNSDTKIMLSYTQILKEDQGLVRFNYPLRSAKPGKGNIGEVQASLKIESTVPIKTLYSPTPGFNLTRKTDTEAEMTVTAKDYDPASDLDVIYSRDAGELGLTTMTFMPNDEPGYFLLTITPKVVIDSARVIKKDIVFVCDTSGSMMQDGKMEQAKNAIKFCLKSLNSGDRFNVVSFGTEVRQFKADLVTNTPANLAGGTEHVDKLQAAGGTALNEAVLLASKMLENATNVPIIILITDGNPTIGETNHENILKNIRAANKNSRLFTFGVGYDLNTRLVDLIAEQNRGMRDYVQPKEDIEVKVSGFYAKISNPVLSNLKLDFGGAEIDQLYPRQIPDLFQGGQISLMGRFKTPGSYKFTLTGDVAGETKSYKYDVTITDTRVDHFLPRMWAIRKVAFLLDEIRFNGEQKELVDEVVALGKMHGILTPYTSFLVLEDGAIPPVGGGPRPIPMPMERAQAMKEAGNVARQNFSAPSAAMGRGSVQDSLEMNDMKKSEGAQQQAQEAQNVQVFGMNMADKAKADFQNAAEQNIKIVYGKTFYVQADQTWLESNQKMDDPKIKEVKLYSKEFFSLLKKHPELGKMVAQNQKIIVQLGKDVYSIK